MQLRAVVVDDEELARKHLCRMLLNGGIEVVAEGETGMEALRLCKEHKPDILFLDIRIADLNGIQAAEALGHFVEPPLIVFVTAYAKYASEAIEWNAFDYLVKPVIPERLSRTIERAFRRLTLRNIAQTEPSAGSTARSSNKQPRRLPVRTRAGVNLLNIEEIEYAVCNNKSVIVRVGGKDHRVNYSVAELEALLPADEFVRVHASVLARLELIDSFNFLGNHAYSVTMRSGLTLPVGRNHHARLKRRLGITVDPPPE